MRTIIITLCTALGCTLYAANFCPEQPPLTDDMRALGLTEFPHRNQQVIDIYLCDDETWQRNKAEAKRQFDDLKQKEESGTPIQEILKDYWQLAIKYDYALANAEIAHAFNCDELPNFKGSEWFFFLYNGRPIHIHMMDLYREGYLSDKELYLDRTSRAWKRQDSDDCSSSTRSSDYRESASRGSTPPSEKEHLLAAGQQPIAAHTTVASQFGNLLSSVYEKLTKQDKPAAPPVSKDKKRQ